MHKRHAGAFFMQSGYFITLEGGEGVGKSTQLSFIQAYLQSKGTACLITREPGGTPLGEEMRPLFLHHDLSPEVELLMILAMRRHHIETVIAPALASGTWVICDRFIDSTFVYQGLVHGKSISWIEEWHQKAGISLRPHLSFIFQDSVEKALHRRHQDSVPLTKFDRASLDFHQCVAKAYLSLQAIYPERCLLLPPNQTIQETSETIIHHLETRFLKPEKISDKRLH